MPVIKGLEWTFDTVAGTYEKMRPGYPQELYQRIFDEIAIDSASRVVEVGIGAGQATLPILQTGCTLTAVEYGEHFSELLKEKFKEFILNLERENLKNLFKEDKKVMVSRIIKAYEEAKKNDNQ